MAMQRVRFDERLQSVLAEAVRRGSLPEREYESLLLDPDFDDRVFTRFRDEAHAAGLALPEREEDTALPRDLRDAAAGPERDLLDIYLDEIGRVPLLAHDRLIELARRAQVGDGAARKQIILANLRLVVYLARGYRGRGLPMLDLIEEGNLGLIQSADRFEPQRGLRFSTHAAIWIRQSILRAIAEQARALRIPVQMFQQASRYLRAERVPRQPVGRGAPLDLMFQSIAGSQGANQNFGVSVRVLDEALDLARREGTAQGPNVMYFETGQGTALSANAHHDTDQVTMEARAYGLARRYQPFLLNSVVGFIGPEYLRDAKEITRAGLEDHFMGKLTGISMGCDACYTNHAIADQNDQENLEMLLTLAGVNYLMGIPMGDDVMLNYQTTSFHNNAALRELFGHRPAPEFAAWLEKLGLWLTGKPT